MSNDDTQTQPTDVRRLPMPERTLTVTPLDLRQAKFGTAMRGFDRAEVTTFLLEAADGYEQALRENERLRQETVRLEASLNQHRELEGSLKSTLMSAQKVADDMRENANQEAARGGGEPRIDHRRPAQHDRVHPRTGTARATRRPASAAH